MVDAIVWDTGEVTRPGPGFTAESLAEEWVAENPGEGKPFNIISEDLVGDHPSVKALLAALAAADAPVTVQDVLDMLEDETPGRAAAVQAKANERKATNGNV